MKAHLPALTLLTLGFAVSVQSATAENPDLTLGVKIHDQIIGPLVKYCLRQVPALSNSLDKEDARYKSILEQAFPSTPGEEVPPNMMLALRAASEAQLQKAKQADAKVYCSALRDNLAHVTVDSVRKGIAAFSSRTEAKGGAGR